MSSLVPLLACVAEAASRREPLGPALRAIGEDRVADAVEAGASLPDALGGRLDPRHRILLAGPHPGLEEAALFALADLRQRQQRSEALLARLVHPLVTWVCLVAICGAFLGWQGLRPDAAWCAMAAAATLLALLPLAVLGDGDAVRRADQYARAALACRWRLPEDRLAALLGSDLAGLAPLLGRAGAEDHLLRLADFHRRRAERRAWWLIVASSAILYAAGGLLLLATAYDPLSQALAEIMRSCADI